MEDFAINTSQTIPSDSTKIDNSSHDSKKSKKFKYIAVILIVLVFASSGVWFGRRLLSKKQTAANPDQLGAVTVATDANEVLINRDFSFRVYDKDKKLGNPVKYTITTAQLTKEIIIKGQKATAVKGRSFLIINLKLVNDFQDSLFLNTRNYVRIQQIGSQDKLAPEIHNDTIEVQPLSTKLTRIGLPVDDGIKNFTLFVGELEGEKQEIPVQFP